MLLNRSALVTADTASNSTNNWTDAAVVDAHAYSAYTYDYYFKRFGRRGLDNANHKLANMVHLVKRSDIFTAPDNVLDFYLNAFYCGDCAGGVMVYGEGLPGGVYLIDSGQRFDFFSGALDVVAHELTHGVTDLQLTARVRQRVRCTQRVVLRHDGDQRRVLLPAGGQRSAPGRLSDRRGHRGRRGRRAP